MSADKLQPVEPRVLLDFTARIVSAYAGNTTLTGAELIETIASVSHALGQAAIADAEAIDEKPVAAVSVKKSVTPDFLICLEDGKKLRMLKRHLMTRYGMTPDQYRTKWNLPKNYPMVAPNYARQRSELAKEFGLGKSPRKTTAAAKDATKATVRKRRTTRAVG